MEEPEGIGFYSEFGHGVPPVADHQTDVIHGCSVEKDGGADGDDDGDGAEDDEVGMSGCWWRIR